MVTMDRFQSVGLALRFNSLGEIPGTILESTEKRLTINLLHQYKERNMRIDSDIRYDSQSHNLYGLRDINWNNISSFRSSLVNPLQRLNYLSVKSKWQWYESLLSKMNFNTYITSDSFDSTEYIFNINALFRIPFLGNYLDFTPNFELINSNFKSDYFTDLPIDFKNALTQLQIKFLNFGKKFNFVLGINGFYLIDEQNQFFVYPKFEVSYKSIDSKIVPFIDYEGGYKLNSYNSFSLENPYVAPVLNIQPTEVNHNLNIGFNLFPSSGLTLKMSASYIEYNNFGMFVRLPYDNFNNDIAFRLGNSYRVIYDQVEKKGLSSGFILQLKEFNKKNIEPKRILKEERLTSAEDLLEVGSEVSPKFNVGDKVCVQSKSTGKGFAGAMKRHNFSGMRASHGVSISHRAHGSTGQNQNPGKVFKGKKMAGHLGDEVTTTKNLEVLLVDTDKKLILLKGSVPGKNKSVVRVYK